jgi:hypothetical protein
MERTPVFIALMPVRRRRFSPLWFLCPLTIFLGIYIMLGLAGVRLPMWSDHFHVRLGWPPVEYMKGPHAVDEPR